MSEIDSEQTATRRHCAPGCPHAATDIRGSRHGRVEVCENVPPLSSYGLGSIGGTRWGGALADLVDVPFADAMLVPIPDELDARHLASLSDNMPNAYRAISSLQKGDDVLIVGGGSIGLYATGLALARGADVSHVDESPLRCGIAETYGAQVRQGPLDKPTQPGPHVINTSADPEQLRHALLSTDPEGSFVDAGIYFDDAVPLPLLSAYTRGVTFRTCRAHARRDMAGVLAEITTGRFDPSHVTSEVIPWDAAAEAFAVPYTKIVISRT